MIFIFVLCLLFAGCDNSMSPWGGEYVGDTDNTPKTYKVYVCGAVENEGYYQVTAGETYYQAIIQAGLLPQSALPANFSSIVNEQQLPVIVSYRENGLTRECINANSEFIRERFPYEALSDEVVNKLADYLCEFGKITNKSILHAVLGEDDYKNYYFKLYIAEADYEEVD